jgi:hypothetical protein
MDELVSGISDENQRIRCNLANSGQSSKSWFKCDVNIPRNNGLKKNALIMGCFHGKKNLIKRQALLQFLNPPRRIGIC